MGSGADSGRLYGIPVEVRMNDIWMLYCVAMPHERFAEPSVIWPDRIYSKEKNQFLYDRRLEVREVSTELSIWWFIRLSDADLTEYNLRFE